MRSLVHFLAVHVALWIAALARMMIMVMTPARWAVVEGLAEEMSFDLWELGRTDRPSLGHFHVVDNSIIVFS